MLKWAQIPLRANPVTCRPWAGAKHSPSYCTLQCFQDTTLSILLTIVFKEDAGTAASKSQPLRCPPQRPPCGGAHRVPAGDYNFIDGISKVLEQTGGDLGDECGYPPCPPRAYPAGGDR